MDRIHKAIVHLEEAVNQLKYIERNKIWDEKLILKIKMDMVKAELEVNKI